ncbi:MAG: hypothetical protein U1E65_16805 [Myxococcota bacterium]
MEIRPSRVQLTLGSPPQKLTVVGVRANGAEVDLSALADLSLEDPLLVSLEIGGVITPMAKGRTQLEARFERLLAVARVEVFEPAVSITASPALLVLDPKSSVQLRVTGQLPDGTARDLTPALTGTKYTVTPPGSCTVSPDGLVSSGSAARQSQITITNGINSVFVGVVPGGAISSVFLQTPGPDVEVGGFANLVLAAFLADGTVVSLPLDADNLVRVTVSDPSVLEFKPEAAAVQGLSEGSATVRIQVGDHSAFAAFNVIDNVDGLRILPDPVLCPTLGVAAAQVVAHTRQGRSFEVTNSQLLIIDSPDSLGVSFNQGQVSCSSGVAVHTLRATYRGAGAQAGVMMLDGSALTNFVAVGQKVVALNDFGNVNARVFDEHGAFYSNSGRVFKLDGVDPSGAIVSQAEGIDFFAFQASKVGRARLTILVDGTWRMQHELVILPARTLAADVHFEPRDRLNLKVGQPFPVVIRGSNTGDLNLASDQNVRVIMSSVGWRITPEGMELLPVAAGEGVLEMGVQTQVASVELHVEP